MINNLFNVKLVMKNSFLLLKIFTILVISFSNALSKESIYFEKGLKLFEKNKFDKSKILFERDLVFNPKNEESYLYLAKIFHEKKNDEEEEINLNNVLILNPQNDQAIYMLALLKIKQSDYNKAKDLIEQFVLVCKSFCSKKDEIQKKFAKLTPEDEKK